MAEPLERLYMSELFSTAPRPEVAAATLLGGAVRSHQGARCLMCKRVVKDIGQGMREGVVVACLEPPGKPEEAFYGITCSEFCRARLLRFGID